MEAKARYDEALEALDAAEAMPRDGDSDAAAWDGLDVERKRCVVRCNRAAVLGKRGEFEASLADCQYCIDRPIACGTRVLVKALFRKSFACEGVGDAEASIRALRAAENIEPDNANVRQAIRNLQCVFHLIVVLDRASPEVLSRQSRFQNFKAEVFKDEARATRLRV
jgi:tetratricopeptide (TPR) repeat protein